MSDDALSLQDAFVESMGEPIPLGDHQIVQADRWALNDLAVVEVRFLGSKTFDGQSVRLSVKKSGKITLSDGTFASVVAIEDLPNLPRFVRHRVESKGAELLVYNAYSVQRGGRSFTESWTGNAGMVVTPLSETARRYECSDGNDGFDRTNLIFEIAVMAGDTPWRPEEIYA